MREEETHRKTTKGPQTKPSARASRGLWPNWSASALPLAEIHAECIGAFALGLVGLVGGSLIALVTMKWRRRRSAEDRIRVEHLMREAEGLRASVESYGLFSVADRSGKIIDVNAGFCAISSYDREELIGQDHRLLNSGHHPKSFWVEVWRTIAAGRTWRGEVCNRAKDGSLYWVDSVIVPILGPGGKLERYISHRFDITARKRAEYALRVLRQRFERAVQGAEEGLFEIDLETRSVWFSDQFRALLGGCVDDPHCELESLSDWEARLHPSDLGHAWVALEEALRGRTDYEAVYRMRHRSGEWSWFRARGRISMAEGGAYLAGSLTDITRQQTTERRLEVAVRAAGIGMWSWDIKSGETYFDPTWYGMLGYPTNSLPMTMETWESLVHPEDYPEADAALTEYLRGGRDHYRVEVRLKTAENGWLWIRSQGELVEWDTAGKPLRMLGAHVVTHQMREALEAAQSASRAKSDFLANMSHEIRTPMTAILGYSDLLAEDSGFEPLSTDWRQAIEAVRSNTRHLMSVIDDILDVSRIEAGRMSVQKDWIDQSELLRGVVELFRPSLAAKGVHLRLEFQGHQPPRIQSDGTRLRQIFLNLLGNAAKFTLKGQVSVTAAWAPEKQRWTVAIADTGIGLTPEALRQILQFEAFNQADGSMSRRFGGSGLGLRISQGFAALLGGGIEAESTDGKGSTFRVSVATGDLASWAGGTPVASTAEREEPKSIEEAQMPLGGARVLLAEDNPVNQRLIEHLLKREGALVTKANHGFEAIAAVNENPSGFAIVLMDMQMPGCDGYTATAKLREQGFARPIIALTAHAMSGDREKCLAAGCDDYMTKPIDRARLREICARWIAAGEHQAL